MTPDEQQFKAVEKCNMPSELTDGHIEDPKGQFLKYLNEAIKQGERLKAACQDGKSIGAQLWTMCIIKEEYLKIFNMPDTEPPRKISIT